MGFSRRCLLRIRGPTPSVWSMAGKRAQSPPTAQWGMARTNMPLIPQNYKPGKIRSEDNVGCNVCGELTIPTGSARSFSRAELFPGDSAPAATVTANAEYDLSASNVN
ncbi:hypothetical protein HRR81_000990 [Exophiala dermatitidis]|nr:hypothetical protein HRR81_000990 [Exophiala dermatitidis]